MRSGTGNLASGGDNVGSEVEKDFKNQSLIHKLTSLPHLPHIVNDLMKHVKMTLRES